MTPGQLRVYLGAAPGVGKTYKMLEEGHRRAAPRHRRSRRLRRNPRPARRPKRCSPAWRSCPARQIAYRGATFTEMDVDAVLARKPDVALIDELAHTNVPGSRNAKRWQDIQRTARRRHHRGHHRQHPASRVHQRRGRADHRRAAARDRARRDRAPRRPDRAGRHDPGGAAPPDGPRQHLPAGEDRRRAGQLLPGRQPHRPARTGPAVGRRQGRRTAGQLPRRAPHHADVGGSRAGRGRPHRRPGGRHAHPPGRPGRRPHQGRRSARRARRPQRRAGRRQ